jgi:hypothetical protein
MCVKKVREGTTDKAILGKDRELGHLEKGIGINLIPVTVSQ